MKNDLAPAVFAASLLLLMSGCGGGSQSQSPVPQAVNPGPRTTPHPAASPSAPSQTKAYLKVTLFKPNATDPASSRRRPAYVPASAAFITFTQTLQAGVPANASTTYALTGCASMQSGETCTWYLPAALGQDQWNVSISSSTKAPLSSAVLAKTIVAGINNVSSLTLNPVVSSLSFVPTIGSCTYTTSCTQTVVLNALDVTGAVIVGPGLFLNSSNQVAPIVLSISDSHGALQTASGSPATTTLTQPSDDDLQKISYNGLGLPGIIAVTATESNVPTATYALTLGGGTIAVNPTAVELGSGNPTSASVALAEPGYTGAFTESDNCSGIAAVGSPSSAGPSASIAVTQVAGGTCSVSVSDATGHSSSIQIVSTTFVVSLQ